MKTLAILTSGGDAPGMNTAIAAATKVASLGWVSKPPRPLLDGRPSPILCGTRLLEAVQRARPN